MALDNEHQILVTTSAILGWIYVLFWSISFYPQLVTNTARKSVTGLSVDFVIASFYGFLCYAIFNTSMYFSPYIREEYRKQHEGKDNLVAFNDVVFATHALLITFLFCIQVFLYRKPNEGPSKMGVALAIALTLVVSIGASLAYFGHIEMLDYLYALSYIKLVLTVVKYIPQVWLNWVRRSTTGWNISNVLLDFFGGFLSIAQLFIDAFTSGHNLNGVMGFLPKFILGIISILFDTLFMLQHYVWFPEHGPHISTQETFNPNEQITTVK